MKDGTLEEMEDRVLAGTGHRLSVLGGDRTETFDRLVRYAIAVIPSHKPTKVISGMAEGWDQAIVKACIHLGIPFVASVPFEGQESVWSPDAQKMYREMLVAAHRVVIVSEGGFAPHKYHIRDEWMVDNSIATLALWNGFKNGGTYNTVKYAEKIKKPVLNVWPGWEEYE